MIPAAFDYVRAGSADEAIAALAEHGDEAKLLAGGHSLVPLMKLRLATPSVLVDVGRLADLQYVEDGGDHVAIGALTRHRDVETSDLLRSRGADPRPRHLARSATPRSATAAPSAARSPTATRRPTCPPCCSPSAPRSWSRAATAPGRSPPTTSSPGFLETALGETELLTEIRVPKVAGAGWSFQKFNRRAQDWAIVGVACVRRAGATAHGHRPGQHGLPPGAGRGRRGRRSPRAPSSEDAAAVADEGTEPAADLNASVEFRRHLARVLTGRALAEASQLTTA